MKRWLEYACVKCGGLMAFEEGTSLDHRYILQRRCRVCDAKRDWTFVRYLPEEGMQKPIDSRDDR